MKQNYLFLILLLTTGIVRSQQLPLAGAELKQYPELMENEQILALKKAGFDEKDYLPPAKLMAYNLTDSIYSYDWVNGDWVLYYKTHYLNDCQIGQPIYRANFRLNDITGGFTPENRTYWAYLPDGNVRTFKTEKWDKDIAFWAWTAYDSLIGYQKSMEQWIKNWNDIDHDFEGGNRTVNLRNNNGYVVVSTQQSWNQGLQDWVDGYRTTYTYDANGNNTLKQVEAWKIAIGQWVNTYRSEFVFNSSGKLIQETNSYFPSNILTPVSRYTYSYDSNGNEILKISESYDEILGNFVAIRRTQFVYDTNNNVISSLSEVNASGNWVNQSKWESTYHANGNKATQYFYIWEQSTQAWIESARDIFLENGNPTYSDYKEGYDPTTGGFGYGSRMIYGYNSEGLWSQDTFDMLKGGSMDTWVPSRFNVYEYDANGRFLESIYSVYNQSSGSYEFTFKTHYFNTGCLFNEVSNEPDIELPMCAHANPLHRGQPIQCTEALGDVPAQLELYAMNGVKMHSQAFREGEGIEPSHQLPSGMYLLLVRGQNGADYRSKVVWMN